MEYARIKVSGSSAEPTVCKPIVAGTIGGTVSFQFDESWDGLIKTLVWRGNGITVDDATFSCIIPAEVVAFPGRLYVGVCGVKDNTATPTIWIDLGQIQPGADPSGDPATDPTLPVWAQVKQEMIKIDDQAVGASTWSSKNTVDKLCPSFTKSGPAVTCEPVEGYPLTVQTDGASKIHRSGKNLIVFTPGTTTINGVTFDFYEDGTIVLNGTATGGFAYTVFSEDIPIRAGLTYTLSGCTSGSSSTHMLYVEDSRIKVYATRSPATAVASGSGFVKAKIVIYGGTTVSNIVIKPQLEIGSSATAFALGQETEEFTPGEVIPALEGVNTLWADSGEVTVTGAADPAAVSRKQDERIKALEASLTALLEG